MVAPVAHDCGLRCGLREKERSRHGPDRVVNTATHDSC